MSIPVALDRLAEAIAEHGPAGYLLTTGDDARPRAVSVQVALDAGRLVMRAGTRTRANVAVQPLVGLLWPPAAPGGSSLIVDGEAAAADDGTVVVVPTWAVLHRPAGAEPPTPGGGGADCVPLTG